MILKVKKLSKQAVLPKYALSGDVGLDLCAIEDLTINPGESAMVRTGIIIELPENTEAQIRPRSGLAAKYSVTVLNSPGTIDIGYRGEIKVLLINHGKKPYVITPKMRIAQMVIAPIVKVTVQEVESVSDTNRNSKGFGSTGNK